MLVIRLLRIGKKNQPSFKIVVTDKRNPARAGRFLEIVGFYNSITKKRDFKADRINHWISLGAQPSDTVHNLLVTEKIIKGDKIPSHNIVAKPTEAPQPVAATPEPAVVPEAPVADPEPVVEEKPVEAPVENK